MRIAEPVRNTAAGARAAQQQQQQQLKPAGRSSAVPNTYATNFLDTLNDDDEDGDDEDSAAGEGESVVSGRSVDVVTGREDDGSAGVSEDERKVLDRVAEALARLGRVKRVGLGVAEKVEFARMWTKKRR